MPCVVLDPFAGAGTTGLVALRLGRDFLGVELNPSYCRMARRRLARAASTFRAPTAENSGPEQREDRDAGAGRTSAAACAGAD